MSWSADSIQALAYLEPNSLQSDALQLWGKLFPGDSPDEFKRSTGGPALLSVARGERDGIVYSVVAQPNRVQIGANRGTSGVPPTPETPHRIEEVAEVVPILAKYLKQLIDGLYVVRVAMVTDTSETVAEGDELEALKEAVPSVPFPSGAIDTLFQFNVRMAVESHPEVLINRICTWAVGDMAFVPAEIDISPSTPPTLPTSRYVGVKIDINSAPEISLSSDSITDVIDCIVNETLMIHADPLEHFK